MGQYGLGEEETQADTELQGTFSMFETALRRLGETMKAWMPCSESSFNL